MTISTYTNMDFSSLVPRILTPFNYSYWMADMKVSLCKIGLFRMTMGIETEPQQYVEKNKFLNQLDEAFGFMCTHISWDILSHLKGLRTPKEAWEKLESLFEKQDDLRGHVL